MKFIDMLQCVASVLHTFANIMLKLAITMLVLVIAMVLSQPAHAYSTAAHVIITAPHGYVAPHPATSEPAVHPYVPMGTFGSHISRSDAASTPQQVESSAMTFVGWTIVSVLAIGACVGLIFLLLL